MILVTESKESLVEVMVDRFKKQLAEFNMNQSRKYPITISFGVSHSFPEQPIGLDELMQVADKAMYEEKLAKRRL